ncbi:MAG: hypothetical protein K2I81_02740 [Alphaproteobacteria bacterium]|nr:hypothetical protein [Alphaproteobacteria bacterium]
MSKCPYNNSVECDKSFMSAEFMRQLNIVIRSGGFWLHTPPAGSDCRAQSRMCMRLVAQKQR